MLNKDLTDIRKQKVIDSSIQREDEQKEDINDVSRGYHKLYYTAYISKERIESDKKRRVKSNELTSLQVFFKDFHQKFRNTYLIEQL